MARRNPNHAAAEPGREPALLYALIAARAVTVGELVDFANNIPDAWVPQVAAALARSVIDDYERNRRRTTRRRRLIILGALTTRLAFDIEGAPRDRSGII